jgi:phosphoglycerate-specific signal transduction histidine kinase
MESGQQRKADDSFGNFGKKVDAFIAEVNEAGGKLQKEFQQKFEELKESAEKLKKEAENNERWKEVETSLRKAGEELGNAFKTAFSRRKDQP